MSKLRIIFNKLSKLFVSHSPLWPFYCLYFSTFIFLYCFFIVVPVTLLNILFISLFALPCGYVLHILSHLTSKIIELIINLIFVFTSKAYKTKSSKEKLNITSENVCLVFSIEAMQDSLYRIQAYKDFSGLATIIYMLFLIAFAVFCSISAVITGTYGPVETLFAPLVIVVAYFGVFLIEVVT